jgi:hypothetical protein
MIDVLVSSDGLSCGRWRQDSLGVIGSINEVGACQLTLV